jgi:hypothetical protein
MRVLSAHVQVREDCHLSACDALQARLNGLLQRNYQIGHTTLQFECAACNPNPLYCALNGEGGNSHQHAHGNHESHHHHDAIVDSLDVRRATTPAMERKR